MKKQERRQKYDQILEMYEPVVRAKNYAMRQMIETGKKMGKLRYLMLAVLFIFLFTYHFFFAIFTQLKMREKLARAFSMVMVVVLVFTSVDVTVFAATWNSEGKQEIQAVYSIVTIETPTEELLEQTLPVGATQDQVQFPETLTVTVVDNTVPVATATPEATGQPTATTVPVTATPEATGQPTATTVPVTAIPEATEAPATETPEASTAPEVSVAPAQSPESTEAPDVTETPAESESSAAEPDAASEEDAVQESENEAELEEQNVEAEQPAGEVSRAGQILSGAMDVLFPALKASAAEATTAIEETKELPVTWELVADLSSSDTFTSEIAGEYYTYQPVIPEEYELAEGVVLPQITVTIEGLLRMASGEITLYTGGGKIAADGWMKTDFGIYVGNSDETTFPTPSMGDAATTFEGWYSDKDYQTKAEAPVSGGTYYAKWIRSQESVTGSKMYYEYRQSTFDAKGLVNGKKIGTNFGNGGYSVYYLENTANPSGWGKSLEPSESGEVFNKISGDLYAAQVLSFTGSYVRCSYYIWNRGTTDVDNFNLGVCGEIQAGDNYNPTVTLQKDDIGKYVNVIDSGNEVRLYYEGEHVTDVTSLWLGKGVTYDSKTYVWDYFWDHFFDDSRPATITDPVLNFSWKNMTIPANTVVVKSFLLGCGELGDFALNREITVDTGLDSPTTEELEEEASYIVPEAPQRDGYVFLGWNTSEDGTGKTYQPGKIIYPEKSMTLYAQWQQIQSTAEVTLQLDSDAWEDQTVALYQDGSKKYDLTEISAGVYQSTKVINGTYDIYVNGRKSDATVEIAAKQDAVTVRKTVQYHKLQILVNVDDTLNAQAGTVTLRKGNTVSYTLTGTTGAYTEMIQASEGSYDIFIDGNDTGYDISAEDASRTIDFYTAKVSITDDEPWTNAGVELRDASGNVKAVLSDTKADGNTVTYQKVLQKDTAAALSLYVDDRDVHKTFTIQSGKCSAQLTYYTAKVTVTGELPAPVVTMTNGEENYTFTEADKVYTVQHVLVHIRDGAELTYDVNVTNVLDTQKAVIDSTNKNIDLKYWTVKYYTLTSASDTTDRLVRTMYVRDGSTMPPYTGNAKLSAYTFSHWSETRWTPEEQTGGAEFDYTQPITRIVTLYANFTTPKVEIGEVVYTDENGKDGGDGTYYRMGNLTISGFDPGEESIKYIYLTTANTQSIKFLDTTGIQIINGTSEVSTDGGAVSIAPGTDRVAVVFDTAVSMAEAQDFLRGQIVVRPTVNTEHTMLVEVYDNGAEYVAANAVTAAQTSKTATKLTGGSTTTLQSGTYYLTESVTYTGSSTKSGLVIASGATVYIYIPSGCTLTAKGGNASGSSGAGAGIEVPPNAKLIFVGAGTVNATGGDAAKGGNGSNGGSGVYHNEKNNTYTYGGSSGAGGAGGGGAGAGIGGKGGDGGAGGSAIGYGKTIKRGDENYNGTSGNSGRSGSIGATGGTVYQLDEITINATGGKYALGGTGGSAGSSVKKKNSWNKKDYHTAGGGGGGGAGGGGYSAVGIGNGGSGGNGGGSGGSGGVDYSNTSYSGYGNYALCGGQGGYGGTGAGNGGNGSGNYDSYSGYDKWDRTGGSGGLGGSGRGGSGSSKSVLTSYNTRTTYTISFSTPSSTATVPENFSDSYTYGKDYTFTFPEYQDSNPNVVFLGWQIKNYAKSGVADADLTTASQKRYNAGATLTIPASTYGDISFEAVTESIGGVNAKDRAVTTISQDAEEVTYYTYHVTLQTDGVTVTKGNIRIGDKTVAPSADGTYTLVTTDDAEKDIIVNGAVAGKTSAMSDHTSNTTISYETLKVTVSGKEPKAVILQEAGAPSLTEMGQQEDGTYLYQAERLAETDKGAYSVLVDGEVTGIPAGWGKNAEVRYYTVNVNVQTQGVDATTVTSVELKAPSGTSARMTKTADGQFCCTRFSDDVEYTIYVNGEATDKIVRFDQDHTVEVNYSRYITTVKVQLDGTPADCGTVLLGTERMVRTGVGTYQLISKDSTTAKLTVDGKVVAEDETTGTEKTVDYYTLTYAKAGDAKEVGTLPEDHTWYLSGTTATLLAGSGLTNGGKTFGGWIVDGKVCQPGASVTMSGKVTATAVWNATDISDAKVILDKTAYVYNGQVQLPAITVKAGSNTLQAGTDYELTYQNSNKTTGRDDADGGTVNAINAGTVTVTVTGKGDYAGTVSAKYQITKKQIKIQNLRAVDKVYDGITEITLATEDAYLEGVVAGDDVSIVKNSKAYTYSPDAGENKAVVLEGAAQLTGTESGNYDLEAPDPVTVTISPKTLTEEMFTAESVIYNGTAQMPAVTATDMGMVDGKAQNLITPSQFSVEYQNNIHAGEGTIVLSADTVETDEEGNETATNYGNYKGTVTIHFQIKKALLEITATAASSSFGTEVTDVTNNYKLTDGTIYTEEDKADLAIKAVTSVKKGYAAKNYKDAVTISYNEDNADYEVTTKAADYTVEVSESDISAIAVGYTGVYDGKEHSIRVIPQSDTADDTIKVYYSTTELTEDNYKSASDANPAFEDAGEYTVYYYVASDNYAANLAGSATVKIAKASAIVTANTHTISYGDTAETIVDAAETGKTYPGVTITGLAEGDTESALTGKVSYTSRDYTQYRKVGTYTLTPQGLSAKNYDITYKAGTLNVEPKTVTVKWSDETEFIYTGSEQGITAAIGGLVNNDEVAPVYEKNTAVNAGTYTAKVTGLSGAAASNYQIQAGDTTAAKEWTIQKATNEWTIQPSIQGWTSGSIPNAPTAAAKFGAKEDIIFTYAKKTLKGETTEYSTTVPTEAGDYLMLAAVDGTDNYEALTLAEPVAFTIAAAPEKETVYVTPADVTITYGEDKPASISVTYTDEDGKAVDKDTLGLSGDLSYDTGYVKGDAVKGNAGTYLLTLAGQTSDNYNLVFETGTLTVEPKEVSLIWQENTSLAYTGKEQSVTAAVSGLVNNDAVYVGTYEGNTQTQIGNYTATAKTLAGENAGNYKLPENAGFDWKITKADNAFIITPAMDDWCYGEDPAVPAATAEFGEVTFRYEKIATNILAKFFSMFSGKSTAVPTEAGTYKLIATVEAGDTYSALEGETTFTIKPAEVVITAQDAESSYGAEIQPLTYTLTTLKGKVSDAEQTTLNIRLKTDASVKSAVGTYPITVQTNDNSNITVERIPGIYTVKAIEMTASASTVEVTYDGKAHGMEKPQVTTANERKVKGLEIYYSTEELNSKNYGSGSTVSPTITDAGTMTVYYYAVADNYVPVKGSTTVTVKQKEVTVTAKDAAITYGDIVDNAGVDYQGFLGSDSAEALHLAPSYEYLSAGNTAYVQGSPAGNYRIVPTGLQTNNYSFIYKEGTLTVAKKALTEEMFTLSAEGLIYDKAEKTPIITGQDQNFLNNDSDYTVTYADNVNAGDNTASVIITATENGNYKGSVTKKFSIAPKAVTVAAESAESRYNEAVAELYYHITSGEILEGDDLKFTAVTSVKKGYAAGTYKDAVTVSYDTKNTNYKVTVITADYTVAAAQLEVTADPYQGGYDGKAHTAEIKAKTKKFLTYATIYYSADRTVDASNYTEMSTNKPTFTDAGTHTIYYYAVCNNYEPVSGSVDVVIGKAPLTVTIPDVEITYGEDASEVLGKLNVKDLNVETAGFVGSDSWEQVFGGNEITLTTDYTQYAKAGNWKLSADGLDTANYQVTIDAGTLVVNPKSITFTWQNENSYTYDGNAHGIEAEVAGKAKADDDVTPGSYTGNTAVAAGEYTAKVIKLSGADASNYTFTEQEPTAQRNWKIEKADNSFTISPAISDWTEGSAAAVPYAAAKYGNVVFTYSTEKNGTYTADIPNGGKAGSYWMKAYVAESANYKGLEDTVVFTIRAKDEAAEIRSITIKAKEQSLVYGDAFDASSLTEDDLVITGLAEGQSLNDVTEGTVSFVTDYAQGDAAGTYLLVSGGLTAKEGYEICYAAGNVTVSKKPIRLNWSAGSFVYDGQEHSVSAAVESTELYAGDTIKVTGYEYSEGSNMQNAAVNAGTYTAHAISFSGKNWNNYQIDPESASHTWEITKAPEGSTDPTVGNHFIVKPSIADWTYGETPKSPYAEAKFGTPEFVYADAENGTYTEKVPETAGTWYMKAVVKGTDNYESITSDPVSFTIKKVKVIITADDIASAYGEEIATLTCQVSGSIKAGDDLGIALKTTASETAKVGEYPITVTYTANANYDVTVREGTYFITAVTSKLQVTASGYTGEYDGAAHGITVEVKDQDGKDVKDAAVYYSETELTEGNYGTGSMTSPTLTDAGTKTVYYYVALEDALPVTGSKEITISRKTVTVTAENAKIVYGGIPTNAGVSYDGLIGTDTAESLMLVPEYQYGYAQYQDVGNYQIVPVLADTVNYHFEIQPGTLTVDPKPVTFIWTGNSFSYDGTVKSTTARVKGLENGDAVSLQYEKDLAVNCRQTATDAGEYTAKVEKVTGEKGCNYTIAAGEATASHDWKITSSNNYMLVEPSIAGWTYGDTPAEPVAKSAYGTAAFVYSNSLNGAYTAEKPVNAGTYYMKAVVEATGNYSYYQSNIVSFTIAKAPVRVAADDITAKAGSEVKELTYSIYGTEVENDPITVRLSTTATADSPKGKYPITVEVAASENYEVTTENGVYSILDVDLEVTAVGESCAYDGREHGIHVTVTGEEAQDVKVYYSAEKITDASDLEYAENASAVSPVRKMAGMTTVYYYVVKDGEVIVGGSKSITITKAPLTIKANDNTINKGQMPVHAGVTYEGFAEGEDENNLIGTLTFNYTYSEGQPDGSYSIIPLGLHSANYEITYAPGILTVLPVQEDAKITGVTGETDISYDGTSHTGYEGIPEIEGGGITEFDIIYKDQDGNVLTSAPKDAGTYTVTIKIPDDNAYYKGSVTISFTIAKHAIRILPKDQAMLAGQRFMAAEPEYEGFAGDDNKDGKAIETPAVIAPEAGADLTTAGKVGIKVTDAGSLTVEAAKNYELDNTATATLTIIAIPAEPGKDESGSSVKLDEQNPNSGIVKIAVIKDEENLPKTEIEADFTVEAAEALLDADEINAVKGGKNALVYLLLSEADRTVTAEEKQKIETLAASIAKDVNIGLYLDLALYKKVGDEAPSKITQTGNQTVTIDITLPESLKSKTADVERTYYIIYVHDGVAKQITPQYKDGVLTFEASEFSVYTIAYKDTMKSSGGEATPTPAPGGETTPTPAPGGEVTPTPAPGGEVTPTPAPGGETTPTPVPGGEVTPTPAPGGEVTPTPVPEGEVIPTPGESTSDNSGNDDAPEETQIPAVTPTPGTTTAPISGNNKTQDDRKPGSTESNDTTGQAEQPVASAQPETTAQPDATTQPGATEQPENTTQPETITVGVQEKDKLPTETRKRLEEALKKVTKTDSDIQAGPYVQPESSITGESTGGNTGVGTATLLVKIPEDLRAEGRMFYLMMTDADGNIIILPNESLEDGIISVTGSADAVYQIIYEDGGSTLENMLTEGGMLINGNGKVMTVSTNHCLWHWLILVITLFGLGAIALLGRQKKKYILFFGAVTTVLDLIVAVIGFCTLDWILLIVGILLMLLLTAFLYRGRGDDGQYAAQL